MLTCEGMSRRCLCLGSTAGLIPEFLDCQNLHRPGDSKHLRRLLEMAIKSKERQISEAKRNFEIAKKAAELIDNRRNDFALFFSIFFISILVCTQEQVATDGLISL
jgi:hypothetical protein